MSVTSPDTINEPPSPQTFLGIVDTDERTNLFDVLEEGFACESDESRDICCVGLWAPCCLIGATKAMTKGKFRKKVEPCEGCSVTCCGYFVLQWVQGMMGGSYLTNCVGAVFALHCVGLRNPVRCTDYVEYLFCSVCAACADYKTAVKLTRAREFESISK